MKLILKIEESTGEKLLHQKKVHSFFCLPYLKKVHLFKNLLTVNCSGRMLSLVHQINDPAGHKN